MVELLREMGNYEQNRELALKDLADAKWKQSARKMLDMLLKGSPADFTQPFDELVIVPDGVLWYLPFEALQVEVDGQSQPLISRFRIRYAPTLSLATSDDRGRSPAGNTAVVVGRLFPRDDAAVAERPSSSWPRSCPARWRSSRRCRRPRRSTARCSSG